MGYQFLSLRRSLTRPISDPHFCFAQVDFEAFASIPPSFPGSSFFLASSSGLGSTFCKGRRNSGASLCAHTDVPKVTFYFACQRRILFMWLLGLIWPSFQSFYLMSYFYPLFAGYLSFVHPLALIQFPQTFCFLLLILAIPI